MRPNIRFELLDYILISAANCSRVRPGALLFFILVSEMSFMADNLIQYLKLQLNIADAMA